MRIRNQKENIIFLLNENKKQNRYFRAQNIDSFTSNYKTIPEGTSVEIRKFTHRQTIINSQKRDFTKLRFTF